MPISIGFGPLKRQRTGTRASAKRTVSGKCVREKQVLNGVAREAGFSGPPALIQATFATWTREGARIPEEVMALRDYLARLNRIPKRETSRARSREKCPSSPFR